MNIIFLGAPGAGKGTQSELLVQRFRITLISTGNMLREAVSQKTPIGLEAASFMDSGKLVPDSTIIAMLKERIERPDCKHGFILDGFPRTLEQATALDEMLKQQGKHIDLVIYLDVDEKILVERITGRFTCAQCGRTYHDTLNPPSKAGVCDGCGHTQFKRRSDDKKETVKARLNEYHKLTMPILPFYEKQGCLVKIDGMRPPSEVTQNIIKAVEKIQS